MSRSNIHYEILGRIGRSWTIIEVGPDRDLVTKKAEKLWDSGKYTGIRIMKESYDLSDKSFGSIEIFARGANKKMSKYDESTRVSPCLSPDQLYSTDGRRSIWELMSNTLEEWHLTPTELLHNLEHYYKLNDSGTKLQNAVQRVAISQGSEDGSIQERMRKLFQVIDQAINLVNSLADTIPTLEAGRLNPLIAKIEGEKNRKFLLAISISEYLRPAVTLEDKFGRVVAILNDKRPDWVVGVMDQLIAEFFQHKKLLPSIMGPQPNRAQFMIFLAEFQAGNLAAYCIDNDIKKTSLELLKLDEFLLNDQLDETKRILVARLKEEIESPKALIDGAVIEKLQSLKAISEKITTIEMDVTVKDALRDALKDRSGRMVNSQSIGDYLVDCGGPAEKIEGLLEIANNAIGSAPKRTVANFLLPILETQDSEAYFLALNDNPIDRLKELTNLQQKVKKSELNAMHTRKVVEVFDGFARIIADKTQLFKKVMGMKESVVDKIYRLLHMLVDGYFPDGKCRDEVAEALKILMREQDFMLALATGFGSNDAQMALEEFKMLLLEAGISE